MPSVEQLLWDACARSAPVELHYVTTDGAVFVGRARLAGLENGRILVGKPTYVDHAEHIPAGRPLRAHVALAGSRYQFDTVIEDLHVPIRLNEQQRVAGIALRKPASLARSQRRSHVRVSVAAAAPISVALVRPHPEIRNTCPVDAERYRGRMINISAGGVAVLVDSRAPRSARPGERFYLTFALPSVEGEFWMLGSLRHARVVKRSESVRLALAFRSWGITRLSHHQRRIQQFIADEERKFLRRRK